MTRALLVVALIAALFGRAAHADATPDSLAEDKAKEANLESNAPRRGVTVALALGGGLLIANGGAESIPAASFRLGHVATPTTVLTLELTGGTFVHKAATSGPDLYDGSGSALIGAQRYIGPSIWFRTAGGINIHSHDDGMTRTAKPGPAVLFGVGIDIVVRHLWRLGLEGWGVFAVDSGGALWTGAFGIGLAHY